MASYNFNAPKITFANAMKASLSISVKECAPEVFAAIARHAAQRTANPEQVLKALENMDFAYDTDRWAAMLELKAHGATLPIEG